MCRDQQWRKKTYSHRRKSCSGVHRSYVLQQDLNSGSFVSKMCAISPVPQSRVTHFSMVRNLLCAVNWKGGRVQLVFRFTCDSSSKYQGFNEHRIIPHSVDERSPWCCLQYSPDSLLEKYGSSLPLPAFSLGHFIMLQSLVAITTPQKTHHSGITIFPTQ